MTESSLLTYHAGGAETTRDVRVLHQPRGQEVRGLPLRELLQLRHGCIFNIYYAEYLKTPSVKNEPHRHTI